MQNVKMHLGGVVSRGQHAKARHVLPVGLAAILCTGGIGIAKATEFPQPGTEQKVTSSQYPGVTCQVVQGPMRDGVLLTTFVYAPQWFALYKALQRLDAESELAQRHAALG